LSYAVANSYEKIVVDFKEFGDIWRESGDINKLLRPLKKENNQIDVNWFFVTWYGSIRGQKSAKSLSGKGLN
jgi:hypothetical protein